MASGCFKSTCSFRLAPPYQSLQWCIEDTLHSEKRAISELSESPAELRLAEFKRFAGVRAGHRLQLLNVLDVLQNHGLSFEHTSVAMLICQTIWQIGPLGGADDLMSVNGSSSSKQVLYSAAQVLFANADYLATLCDLVLQWTQTIEEKWSDHVILYTLVMLAHRAIALMPDTDSSEVWTYFYLNIFILKLFG